MATTGELRAIIEELALVDIGDAATYLGEEATGEDTAYPSDPGLQPFIDPFMAKKSEREEAEQ